MKKVTVASAILAISMFYGSAQAGNSLLKETVTETLALKIVGEVNEGGYNLISVAEIKSMLAAKEDFVLIDAHPKVEYDLAYIDGAINIGFKSKRAGKWELDAEDGHTQADYKAALGSDLNKKIVIYCGFVKCGRSHNAAMWARYLGYKNVYRAPGGISAWMDSGFPYKTKIK
ncbi:MAG: rhodanese-like domain-containing protein [Candidatus Thiodiazotropha sp. DIVDIV]